jgi:hypothetical protein
MRYMPTMPRDLIERLERREEDVQRRLMARRSQLEAEGRWPDGDPHYLQLASVLKEVRNNLRETEDDVLRRTVCDLRLAA